MLLKANFMISFQLDVIEDASIRNVILLKTVLDEVSCNIIGQ